MLVLGRSPDPKVRRMTPSETIDPEEVARFENPVQGFLRVFDRSGHRRRG